MKSQIKLQPLMIDFHAKFSGVRLIARLGRWAIFMPTLAA